MMQRKYEFSAGCLSLNLVDTVAGRAGESVELLVDPQALADWLGQASFGSVPPVTQQQLRSTRKLREAIFDSAVCVTAGDAPPMDAIDIINSAARRVDLRPQYANGAVVYQAENFMAAALSRIAADAIETMGTELRARLRRCPECEMVFRDNSRPGRRKWCSSSSGCGNRAKVRRHRANQKESKSSD